MLGRSLIKRQMLRIGLAKFEVGKRGPRRLYHHRRKVYSRNARAGVSQSRGHMARAALAR